MIKADIDISKMPSSEYTPGIPAYPPVIYFPSLAYRQMENIKKPSKYNNIEAIMVCIGRENIFFLFLESFKKL